MISEPQVFTDRQRIAQTKLKALPGALEAHGIFQEDYPKLAIYATGSYGRCEADHSSDLDLFFVDVAADNEPPIGNIQTILLLAGAIRTARALEFREFSKDGLYLQVHKLPAFKQFLGTSNDDHLNLFTARMLLLLESECIFGKDAYDKAVEFVLGLYWRDDKGSDPFLPLFLINDVIRYWKTLCLSYEASRTSGTTEKVEVRRSLIKLRCSRLWMCFNFLALLIARTGKSGLALSSASEVVGLRPVERILKVAEGLPEFEPTITRVLDGYAWFLEFDLYDTSPKLREYLDSEEGWKDARAKSREFGNAVGELVFSLADRAGLKRFITI